MAAFAGESQARNKYHLFRLGGQEGGLRADRGHFLETAEQEKEHAKLHLKLLEGIGDTRANLKAAAGGEKPGVDEDVPGHGQDRPAGGLRRTVALLFECLASIEKEHEARYAKLLKSFEAGTIFAKPPKVKWRCRNCGFTSRGPAPQQCPACKHPQAYFEVVAEGF